MTRWRTTNLFATDTYGLLAWVYLWLTQMFLRVDPQAWLFLAVITVFNLTLAFVELINGSWKNVAAMIVINGIIFANSVREARFLFPAWVLLVSIYILITNMRSKQ